eukprot:scaffold303559_cov22-Tisochrysis_lutea.AAC.1
MPFNLDPRYSTFSTGHASVGRASFSPCAPGCVLAHPLLPDPHVAAPAAASRPEQPPMLLSQLHP